MMLSGSQVIVYKRSRGIVQALVQDVFVIAAHFAEQFFICWGTEVHEVAELTEACSVATEKKSIDALKISDRCKTYPCTRGIGELGNDNGSKDSAQVIVG
jgi:hypothetical protein